MTNDYIHGHNSGSATIFFSGRSRSHCSTSRFLFFNMGSLLSLNHLLTVTYHTLTLNEKKEESRHVLIVFLVLCPDEITDLLGQ
jgi:hypothetical protein